MEQVLNKTNAVGNEQKTISDLLGGKKMRSVVIRISTKDYYAEQHVIKKRKMGIKVGRKVRVK